MRTGEEFLFDEDRKEIIESLPKNVPFTVALEDHELDVLYAIVLDDVILRADDPREQVRKLCMAMLNTYMKDWGSPNSLPELAEGIEAEAETRKRQLEMMKEISEFDADAFFDSL